MAASASDIQGWYSQFLGRPAQDNEVGSWLDQSYGPDPYNQIKDSGEAHDYAAKQGSIFQPGGSPSVPPTAIPTPPANISPSTFPSTNTPPSIHAGAGASTPPPLPGSVPPVEKLVRPYAPFQGSLQLVGFDPNAHMGETPNVSAPKYAVANIIQQMSNQPGFDPLNFAQEAADTLNAMFGTNQFKAADGQTLLYGDEYVHTAPAGYGGGDPNGGEELFWGYTGGGSGSGSSGASGTGAGGGNTKAGGGAAGGVFNGIDIGGLISGLLKPASGANLPGGFAPTGGPLQTDLNQVGQDPLSQLLTSGLSGLITGGGATPRSNSVQDALARIINRGGRIPAGGASGANADIHMGGGAGVETPLDANGNPVGDNLGDLNHTQGGEGGAGGAANPYFTTDQSPALIAARDNEAMAMHGMMADVRSELANRGLLGEPGVPQGPEALGVQRTAEQLAPVYAAQVAQITQHGLDLENSNVMTALQLTTGLSESESQNLLQSLSLGTNRQVALSQIALQTLDQNRQWQQFLATYGLDRDRVAAEIQQGNMQIVVQLINSFLNSVTTGTGGYI